MPRKPRIEFPGALYHVFARGNRKHTVFHAKYDFAKYMQLLADYKRQYDYSIYAFALMPNHLHLLIETGITPLSVIMQGLQQSYTQYVNTKYDQVGHVFQGRYKAILCEKDAYLLELVRYIHLNPVRAGLTAEVDDYLWTAHIDYMRNRPNSFVNTSFILSLFGKDEHVALTHYTEFICDGINCDEEDIAQRLKDKIGFPAKKGSERSAKPLESHPVSPEKTVKTNQPSLDDILDQVSKIWNISPYEICSNAKIPLVTAARQCCCYLARVLAGSKVKEIADYLHITPASVSVHIRKAIRMINTNRKYDRRIKHLMRRISENL